MKKTLLWGIIVVIVVCLIGGYVAFSMGLLDPCHRFYGKWEVTVWDESGSSSSNSIISQMDEICQDDVHMYFTFTQDLEWIWTIASSIFDMTINGIYSVNETMITLAIPDEQHGYYGSETFTYSFSNRDNTLTLTEGLGQIVLIRC